MRTIWRPALRYYGGKWRLANWIISWFPEHTCYAEPFGGAMSVLLTKEPSKIEVYNDKDRDLVTFFKVLRERPAELIEVIQLTPFARDELRMAVEPCEDELEKARRVYVWSMQGISGTRSKWTPGWRFQKVPRNGKQNIEVFRELSHLDAIANRLLGVALECDEGVRIVQRYDTPETLFYCDPPYVADTRSNRWSGQGYLHEMSNEAHAELSKALHSIRGMAVVSGYPSELYASLYSDWKMVTTTSRVNKVKVGKGVATECLWISSAAMARGSQRMMF